MALNKEVWISDLMENLIPDESWMSELRDLSSFVENNKLHIGEAGAMPTVTEDNVSWPLTTGATRTDTDNAKSLKTYDTANQILRNAEAVELVYDKRQSIVLNHQNALRKKISTTAAWNICPDVHLAGTKILKATSGASYADTINKRRAKFADILDMQKELDTLDLPREGRIAVLNPQHLADLMLEDLSLYKLIIQSGQIFDFKLYRFNGTPYFTAAIAETLGSKVALSTAYAAGSHGWASMFFHKQEAFKAIGDVSMYATEKSPTERGDVIGFQVRALVETMRSAYKFAGGLVTIKTT